MTQYLVLLALAQDITELLQRAPHELGLLPEVGGEEAVGVDDGNEGGLEGVLEGLGGAGRGGVGVLDISKVEQTLDVGGGNKASTTGSGNELEIMLAGQTTNDYLPENGNTYTNGDGTTLAALLDGERVGVTKVGTPVTSPDGQDSELGDGDGGTDGGRDFLGGLDTQTDVALGVTDEDDGLETGTLTGTGLLLDGLDLLGGMRISDGSHYSFRNSSIS